MTETKKPEAERYQGWKNHATWCVNLHLNNDRALYAEALSVAKNAIKNAASCNQVASGTWTKEEAERILLAGLLKLWVVDDCERPIANLLGDWPRQLIMDLMSGYFSEVDWDAIAVSWLEELADQVK